MIRVHKMASGIEGIVWYTIIGVPVAHAVWDLDALYACTVHHGHG